MHEVLFKMRELNRLLQLKDWSSPISAEVSAARTLPLNDLAVSLGNILDANTYLINNKGTLLGFHEQHEVNTPRVKNMLNEKKLPDYYTESVYEIKETKANLNVDSPQTIFPVEKKEKYPDGLTTIIPIYASQKRLGTLILGRTGSFFEEEDLILSEHSATIVGIEMLYSDQKKSEEIHRMKHNAEVTVQTLSYSEFKAAAAIVEKLNGKKEGILTATSIADELGITRSIVVNSIRKLESGGLIQSRSLGMKGTFIKLLNDAFVPSLYALKE